ncbi:hypothetical protein ASC97_04985 [Rhizobium sp. Root1203]|jgi:uncharacterized protein YjiS (DUF1127 family)|uniref:DUF1127 domain-containing protein n=1 Tax=Rhizobium sp. Root1203 TaxID=1736427 RepID=UPI0007099C8E|nr:DUF1127 domain-containing protein [Rhizobium sp. Root1203]KQV27732.1 hypothetical protein ASC97_04985 [Rhizobium sp. Root1203]
MSVAPGVNNANTCLPTQKQARQVAIRHILSGLQRRRGLWWRHLVQWHQKRETRRALRNLTDTELLDIGLTRKEARKEASKSFFWD